MITKALTHASVSCFSVLHAQNMNIVNKNLNPAHYC